MLTQYYTILKDVCIHLNVYLLKTKKGHLKYILFISFISLFIDDCCITTTILHSFKKKT